MYDRSLVMSQSLLAGRQSPVERDRKRLMCELADARRGGTAAAEIDA